MTYALNYIAALLRRHTVSFLLACIVPIAVGLVAVAATTEMDNIKFAEYLYGDDYLNLTQFDQYMIDHNDWSRYPDGFHFSSGAYEKGSEIAEIIERNPVVARSSLGKLYVNGEMWVIYIGDIGFWDLYPLRLYKGGNFTGECNEIMLDVSKMGDFKIGDTYTVGIAPLEEYYQSPYEPVDIEAKVVGFYRYDKHIGTLGPLAYSMISMPNAEWRDIGTFKYNRYERVYCNVEYKVYNELFQFGNPHGRPVAVGAKKRAYANDEEDNNVYTLWLFLFVSSAALCLASDLCLNGSMLSMTERVAVRCGMRFKDVALGNALKAVLQLAFSSLAMFFIVLAFNRMTASYLILESLWAGIVAAVLLGLLSWAMDSIRLYAVSRGKGKL